MNVFKTAGVLLFVCCSLTGTSQTKKIACADDCCSKKNNTTKALAKPVKMEPQAKAREISCKLTSPELRKRKEEVLASLKKKVLFKQELANGYKYKFKDQDAILDELVSFIKTERLCCDFFHFQLDVSGDGSAVWLAITGPEGAKNFINTELEL